MSSTQRRLLGESIREIGVLVLVFIPLNISFESKSLQELPYPEWMHFLSLRNWGLIFFAISGVVLLVLGIKVESKAISQEGGH